MKKIAILLVLLLLSIVFVEAQMFVSPGRNVAARKRAEAASMNPVNRPIQSASVEYTKRYRSERERIKSVIPIIGNNVDPLMSAGRKEMVTRSLKKASGIGVVAARTSQLQWKPRVVLPVKQSHKSVLFNRKRSSA